MLEFPSCHYLSLLRQAEWKLDLLAHDGFKDPSVAHGAALCEACDLAQEQYRAVERFAGLYIAVAVCPSRAVANYIKVTPNKRYTWFSKLMVHFQAGEEGNELAPASNMEFEFQDSSGDSHDLVGVVRFLGTDNAGHFISYVKEANCWTCYNDRHVTQSTPPNSCYATELIYKVQGHSQT